MSDHVHRLKVRTLAAFHILNPAKAEEGNKGLSHAVYLARRSEAASFIAVSGAKIANTRCCASATPCTVGTLTNFTSSDLITPVPAPYDTDYVMYFELSWDALAGATSYVVVSDDPSDLIVSTGATTARLFIADIANYDERTLTLTATTPCGSATATATSAPCFLAGSIVQMADGTTKAIEDVRVGDVVLGAFGEANVVLALHRPLLGEHRMCRINDEHATTNHHPHVSVDKQFYCGDPELVRSATYGRSHIVLDADGDPYPRILHGLRPDRILQLAVGVELKTVEGSRITRTLELFDMPADTQLYNLVVGGSHTYHVDGYAVTGWPREDDFDYDAWAPRAATAAPATAVATGGTFTA
jgi:hypothetical protein